MKRRNKIAVGLLLVMLVGGVSISSAVGEPQSATPAKKPATAPPKAGSTGGAGKAGGGTKSAAKPKRKSKKRGHAASQPASAPAEIPATQPSGPETAAQTLRRLNGVRTSLLKDDQIAMRTALEFCIALGEGAGDRATRVLDATGYQPVPGEGEAHPTPANENAVPEPPRPRGAVDIATQIGALPRIDLANASSDAFELTPRTKLMMSMPGAAAWMLPSDHAIVLRPTAFGGSWPKQPACLIVRVRGAKATVVGGNLLESLR